MHNETMLAGPGGPTPLKMRADGMAGDPVVKTASPFALEYGKPLAQPVRSLVKSGFGTRLAAKEIGVARTIAAARPARRERFIGCVLSGGRRFGTGRLPKSSFLESRQLDARALPCSLSEMRRSRESARA
jgi:hypothetical protein